MYFWLCIDLVHITPPVKAEGYDGSHHPRYVEWHLYLCAFVFIQVMLTVVKDVTYSELQLLISEKVDVPPERQKIRHGFPPKVLEPPAEGEEDKPVDIHHGDKLTLEILPDPNLSRKSN